MVYMSFFIVTYNPYYRLKLVNGQERSYSLPYICLFALLVTLTYFIDSDYFHYYNFVKKLSQGYDIRSQESVYVFIARTFFYNYFLFRVVVWGCALFVFYKTCRKSGIRGDEGIYALMIMYGNIFAYARASLGMAILFYGYCLLVSRHTVHNRLIALGIMVASIFFHTSMAIAMLCCFAALLFKWKKKTILILLLSLPLVIIGLKTAIVNLLGGGVGGVMLLDKLQYYADLQKDEERTMIGQIQNALAILAFLIPIVMIGRRMYFMSVPSDIWKTCRIELYCFQSACVIMLISIAFNFIGFGTEVMVYRIRFMAMIPIVISLLGLYYKHYLSKMTLQFCFLLGFSAIAMILFSALKGAL